MQQFNQVIILIWIHINGNKFLITTEHQTFHFYLPKDVDKNLKNETDLIITNNEDFALHEVDFITRWNEDFAEHRIKNKISQLLFKYNHGNYIHEHKNSKTNEP